MQAGVQPWIPQTFIFSASSTAVYDLQPETDHAQILPIGCSHLQLTLWLGYAISGALSEQPTLGHARIILGCCEGT